ncbi:MAG TPA: TonB-dependent receptor [Blastocatellia bacterium]|nr:TonB-dependent receptor [Blastocatellia bacterium]
MRFRLGERCLACLGLCVLIWAAQGRLTAQTVDATLRGVVVDQQEAVLPGIAIRVTNDQTGIERRALTDQEGRYTLTGLSAGTYRVEAVGAGFEKVERERELNVGTTVTLDLQLSAAGRDEIVQVVGATSIIPPTENVLGRVVQTREIDALPVVGRSFSELAAITPGVRYNGVGFLGAGSVVIGGATYFQNHTLVDGSSENYQLDGTQRSQFSLEWIQEFQVMTNQFNAEYGGASGGIINTITRSGGNGFHGRGYSYFRSDALDARNPLAPARPPSDQQRFGFTFGGPIIKNRLFFFGGYERFNNDQTTVVVTPFVSANGAFPVPQRSNLNIARLDYQVTDSHRLRARFNRSRLGTRNEFVGGPNTVEYGARSVRLGADFSGDWTWILSPRLLNEARFSYGRIGVRINCNRLENDAADPGFELDYGTPFPVASFGCFQALLGSNLERQRAYSDTLSMTRGGHQIKTGFLATHSLFHNEFARNRRGIYNFQADAVFPFNPADPASYPSGFQLLQGPIEYDFDSWAVGLFVQDSWSVRDNLTLNLGLRYDVDDTLEQANPFVPLGRFFHRINEDRNNVAPRVGVAWAPFHDQKRTVLRVGGGYFYNQVHNQLLNNLFVNTITVDRSINIQTDAASSPALNPFHPDVLTPRLILAQALAGRRVPDVSNFPARTTSANDLTADLRVPRTAQLTAGLSRDLGRGVSFTADFVYSRGFDQLILRDTNVDPASQTLGAIRRLNPNYSSIITTSNDGTFTYKSLRVQSLYQPRSSRWLRLAYTLARGTTNVISQNGLFDQPPFAPIAFNPFNLNEDAGPLDNDIRHTLNLSGGSDLPFGFQVSTILSYNTAAPWTVTTLAQLDRDPFPDRPEPRASRRGDGYFSWDLRFAKVVRLGERLAIAGFAEGFNLTNTSSFIGYVGDLSAPNFGRPTAALDPRRIQLGFRVDF